MEGHRCRSQCLFVVVVNVVFISVLVIIFNFINCEQFSWIKFYLNALLCLNLVYLSRSGLLLRKVWRQKWGHLGSSKVYLIKWPASSCSLSKASIDWQTGCGASNYRIQCSEVTAVCFIIVLFPCLHKMKSFLWITLCDGVVFKCLIIIKKLKWQVKLRYDRIFTTLSVTMTDEKVECDLCPAPSLLAAKLLNFTLFWQDDRILFFLL